MTAYQEAINKAAQCAALLRSDVIGAYKECHGAVECIVLEQLLGQASALDRDLRRLAEAAKSPAP